MRARDLATFLSGALLAALAVFFFAPRASDVRWAELGPRSSASGPRDRGGALDGGVAGEGAALDELGRARQRVTSAPHDPRAWIALGDAEAAYEELDAAEHAYRTALRIRPDGLAYAQLGFLLYGRGREDEARVLLGEAKRLGADVPLLDATLERLRAAHPGAKDGEPSLARAEPASSGAGDRDAGPAAALSSVDLPDGGLDAGPERKLSCNVPVHGERGGGGHARGMLVDVVIDGRSATLLVDTGATLSVVSEDFAARAGLRSGEKRFGVMTANGRTTFASAHARHVTLEGRTVSDVVLALCPDCVHGLADGLLGLDLQAALGLEIDLRARALRFSDCAP